ASASTGANITFGAVDGGSSILRVDAGTGGNTVLFTGSTELSQLLTESNNYGVSFFGSDNSIANATIFNNSGALRFGDAASDAIEFTAGVTVNSATTINGTVSTTGSALALQQLIVGEGGTARIETSGGAVSVSGLVSGEPGVTPENLIVDAGDVTFDAGVQLNDVNITGSEVAFNQGADLSGTLTVSATNFNVAGATLEVDGGLVATSNVTLGQNVVSENADVSITGALTLSEDADVAISTANGDLTVTGNISGTSGANNETLTIDTGTGRVSFQDVFGAGTSDNAGGLTDVTLINSGAFSVEQIAITGALTQQNAATGATTLNDEVSVGSAALSGTSFTLNSVDSSGDFTIAATGATTLNGNVQAANITLGGSNVVTNGMSASGNLTVNATGDITQLGETISVAGNTTLTAGDDLVQQGGSLNTTGTLTVTADQLDLADFSVVGLASLTATGNANLGHSGDLNLAANVSRSLTLTNNGDVTIVGSIGRDVDITADAGGISSSQLTVGGTGRYEGQSLDLVTDSAGAIEFTIEDDVSISNLGGLEIQGTASNLTLSAGAGRITDTGTIVVTDALNVTANGSLGGVELNNNNQFGSINVQSSGAVTINETDGTVIDGLTAASFELDSQGGVTDSLNSSISITGLTTITADGDIILGNDSTQTVSLGAIELTGEAINIQNDGVGLIEIIDLDADSLTLITAGDIEGDIGAAITVDDDAVIQGQDVQLTNGNVTLGSLDLVANNAALDSQNVTRFTRLDVANDFFLNSVGAVQGDPGAQLSVGGTFVISSDDSVTLNGEFSGLDVTATTVDLQLNSAANIENIEAVSLTVDAGDNALSVSDFGLQVENAVALQAGSIALGGDSSTVGSLTATASAGGTIDVTSSISSTGDILLGADIVRLGGAIPITLSTEGALDAGLITITASPDSGANGQLFVNGEVTLDTAAIPTAQGADITLLVSEAGQGEIGTEADEAVTTRLVLNAKGGDVNVANLIDAA
ncbi:MAG: beta strand repeat-containing protein, partial [Pseudomonadales bacterium]